MTLDQFQEMLAKWRARNPNYEPTKFQIREGYHHAVLFGENCPPKSLVGHDYIALMPSNDNKGVWFLHCPAGAHPNYEPQPYCVPTHYITTRPSYASPEASTEEALLRNEINELKNTFARAEARAKNLLHQVRALETAQREILEARGDDLVLEAQKKANWYEKQWKKASNKVKIERAKRREAEKNAQPPKALSKAWRRQAETIQEQRVRIAELETIVNTDLSNSMTESQILEVVDQEESELHKLEMAEMKQRGQQTKADIAIASFRYAFYQTAVRWACGTVGASVLGYCLS